MFGDSLHNPDFTNLPTFAAQLLPIPLPTDSLPALVKKLEALAQLVETGKSVAVYTQHDPEALARERFTPMEQKQFDAWKAGAILHPPDWSTAHATAATSARAIKRQTRRTNALRIIYKNDTITPENCAWVHTNMPYALPLVVAVSKVDAAFRELQVGQEDLEGLTRNELAEVQAIHKINAVAMKRINSINQEFNRLNMKCNAARKTLQAREDAIERKLQAGREPVNKQPEAVGIPKIGRKMDYTTLTGGSRHARTNLLAGTGLGQEQLINRNKRTRQSEEDEAMERQA